MFEVPHREIGLQPLGQAAPIVVARARARRGRSPPRSASSGVSPNSVQAMFSISRNDSIGEVPGVVIAGDRDRQRRPDAAHRPEAGGFRAGSKTPPAATRPCCRMRPSRPRRRRRGTPGVARQRAAARSEHRAAGIAELFGMQLHRQPQPLRLREYARDLLASEGDPLAVGVHRVDQGLGVQLRASHPQTASM